MLRSPGRGSPPPEVLLVGNPSGEDPEVVERRHRCRAVAMSTLLFHKPYGVLSQFRREPGSRWESLAPYIDCPGVHPAGRLDADSEGLLLLTAEGWLQHRLTDPRWGHWRTYLVQVEGLPGEDALHRLQEGIPLGGRITRRARVRRIDPPHFPERCPPIRRRLRIPTSWMELQLGEGRNRQVRRMTAAVGLPTLRLIRVGIDLMDGGPPLSLAGLAPGCWRRLTEQESLRLRALADRNPGGSNRFRRSRR